MMMASPAVFDQGRLPQRPQHDPTLSYSNSANFEPAKTPKRHENGTSTIVVDSPRSLRHLGAATPRPVPALHEFWEISASFASITRSQQQIKRKNTNRRRRHNKAVLRKRQAPHQDHHVPTTVECNSLLPPHSGTVPLSKPFPTEVGVPVLRHPSLSSSHDKVGRHSMSMSRPCFLLKWLPASCQATCVISLGHMLAVPGTNILLPITLLQANYPFTYGCSCKSPSQNSSSEAIQAQPAPSLPPQLSFLPAIAPIIAYASHYAKIIYSIASFLPELPILDPSISTIVTSSICSFVSYSTAAIKPVPSIVVCPAPFSTFVPRPPPEPPPLMFHFSY